MAYRTIIYITPSLIEGGAEKFLILLSNSQTDETAKQIVVSLSATNALRGELDKRIDFISLSRNFKFDIKPILKLRRLIKSEKPAIIFCINFYSYFISRCAMFALKAKAARIISYHSTVQETRKEHLLHKLYSFLLTKKDTIITVSANQAKYTSEKYNIPQNKFTTIHNGIDINYWCPAPDDADRKLIRTGFNLPPESPVIIMAAALRVEKNHIGAVKALHLLHNKYYQKAYLLIVGDGIMHEAIKKLAIELNIGDYIRITGMQDNVRPFYRAADLFTLCSTTEAFSIAALEAMGCGLPCVLTNVGGADEMVKDNINGFVCNVDENDIALSWSKALKAAFSKDKIHTFARDYFSLEKMLSSYKKIFEQK
jgi:glycosyltransferase involved in cell wall biosynthesis